MKKKLIEVALPLVEINAAAAKEKSIRHGHPSTLHLWWARRPLAACRAVLFASLVDDPSSDPSLSETEAEAERERLFGIIRRLVRWENSKNEEVLAEARAEILRSTNGNPPPVLDPFCGGGSIPLEAQRLGLEAHGSDLNPVAVLITKALIELPPKFAGQPPVNPVDRAKIGGKDGWPGATGLAADVRHYGQWMRDEAEKRIGHLYPKATLPPELGGGEATVIAWLWARTVTCPNPACRARMPLVSSFALSTKARRKAWVEPIVDHPAKTVRFEVRQGDGPPPEPPKLGRGGKFRCLVCQQTADERHIRSEGQSGRMDAQLMAVVAEGRRGRLYLPPSGEQEAAANVTHETWTPNQEMPKNPRWFSPPMYGLNTYGDLFTPRQLVALTTFSDLVGEARERVRGDAVAAGLADDGVGISDGGLGATAYADAVATYLAFAIDKAADRNTSLCSWENRMDRMRNTFGRQALPMIWDYAETNPFAGAAGDIRGTVESLCEVLDVLPSNRQAVAHQTDVTSLAPLAQLPLISTDPPYYDNVGYADLSDFFYVWLRRSLRDVYPDLFRTLLVPKAEEMIASPYRFDGDRQKAEQFFEDGLRQSFAALRQAQHPDYPLTVYYAFKQTESERDPANENGLGVLAAAASTGWETMLAGLLGAGFAVTGTWPMRTELSNRMVGRGTNALASSIVLVCRPRHIDAEIISRRDFTTALRRELPDALIALQHGNIAPVDLAQASIGPGMAIFSRYAQVLEADGTPMRIRAALQLINQELDAYLEAQEGEQDADTRFCIAWFDQYAHRAAPFGMADVLARAKNTSVQGLVTAGVLEAAGGKVRLLRRDELNPDWDPQIDRRPTIWEATQHLIRRLHTDGVDGAAALLAVLGSGQGEAARALAYRLYQLCDRKKWAEEALAYNTLVVEWPSIQGQAAAVGARGTYAQAGLRTED